MSDNPPMPQLLSSKVILDNPRFSVREDTIKMPNGQITDYIVAEPQCAVFMVATTISGLYVLVRQLRYPLEQETLEVPAGMLPKGVNPLVQAQCELEEEIGFRAKSLELIATLQAWPSRQDRKQFIIRARGLPDEGLHYGGQEHDEAISAVETYTKADVLEMIKDGRLQVQETVAALLLSFLE